MEFEVSYSLDNEEQFWDELDDIISVECKTHELIDNALRSYLSFTTKFREEYLQSDYNIAKCSYRLIESALFTAQKEYVRRQIIYGLLQEDEGSVLHMIASFLLFDGKNNDETFEMMQVEGAFPRLVELINESQVEEEPRLHRLLMELLYEMSRIQRLTWEDLMAVDDAFVVSFFQKIEEASDDVNDPYHYPLIRVLLVLNEQYMVASTTYASSSVPLTNRVIKALSIYGTLYKNFGCNLILLLNRESETSLQLLILKVLYLLFQNPATAEYFYTNDLHVLLDVILRNLLDLPYDSSALRHTYLRVLHPLLSNSQISRPPHYKQKELRRMLNLLTDSGTHFAPIDETTIRLASRCNSVPWLEDVEITSPTSETNSPTTANHRGSEQSPTSMKSPDSRNGDGQRELARRMLGMSVKEAGESDVSVAEVAVQMERPGIKTPSRNVS